jgi:hypothetical protein
VSFGVFDERILNQSWITLDDSNTPGGATWVNGGTFGCRVDWAVAINSDVVDHIIYFTQGFGVDARRIGSINVPAGTGFAGAAALDVVPLLSNVNTAGILVGNSGGIYVGTEDTIASGVFLGVNGIVGLF